MREAYVNPPLARPLVRTGTSPSDIRGPVRVVARPFRSDKWEKTAIFLLFGYVLFNRSFAYIGIPQLRLFIGEAVLLCFLVFRQREGIDTFAEGLVRPGPSHDCAWAMLLFVLYGIFETCRGVALGYSIVTCLENLAFNYYALYILFGWWVGRRNPNLLRTVAVRLSWFNGVYGVAFILFLSRVPLFLPGQQGDAAASLFGQPWGSALSLLGLLCFEKNLEKVSIPLALNTFVMLGMQVRAEWIGFLAGLMVYAFMTKRVQRVMVGLGIASVLLAIGYIADFRLPGALSRGGEISTREIVARALAPLDPQTASNMTSNARTYEETASWRTNWWKAIWVSVHRDAETAAIGHGYGYPLVDLVPYLKGRYYLRTPHSIFFYALGYGGWLQVLVLVFLEAAIVRLLWRAFVLTGQPYGLVAWAAITAWVFFDSAFESPFRGIPFFLLTGIAMAPALTSRRRFA